jgi:predicted nucleic acid-binding protein
VIVIDASVIANMLVYADARGRKDRAVLARDPEWAAPEHWKVEVFSVLRWLTLGRKITPALGERSLARIPRSGIDHVPLDPLLPRMWQIRDTVSGYDAAYVALAEARDLTLVTADAKLARACTPYCRVELTTGR